jgi:putative membrane protein
MQTRSYDMRKSSLIAGSVAALLLVPAIGANAQTTRPGNDTSSTGDASRGVGTHSAGDTSTATSQSAGDRTGDTSGKTGMKAPTSEEFVKEAAQANFAEIAVSQLAQTKAESPDVKSFAQRMIADHSQANSELAQIAKTQNLKVPLDADLKHKASMTMLKTRKGESFDSAYMKEMDKDHQKAIALFQAAASSSKLSPELKEFATKTLPKLEQHHQLVAQVEQSLPTRSAAKSSGDTKR